MTIEIELDELIASLDPGRIVLRAGGRAYTVRDLAVHEVLTLQKAGERPLAELVERVAGVFDGDAPPILTAWQATAEQGDGASYALWQRQQDEIVLIYTALLEALIEVGGSKKLEAASARLKTMIQETTARSPHSAD